MKDRLSIPDFFISASCVCVCFNPTPTGRFLGQHFFAVARFNILKFAIFVLILREALFFSGPAT